MKGGRVWRFKEGEKVLHKCGRVWRFIEGGQVIRVECNEGWESVDVHRGRNGVKGGM